MQKLDASATVLGYSTKQIVQNTCEPLACTYATDALTESPRRLSCIDRHAFKVTLIETKIITHQRHVCRFTLSGTEITGVKEFNFE